MTHEDKLTQLADMMHYDVAVYSLHEDSALPADIRDHLRFIYDTILSGRDGKFYDESWVETLHRYANKGHVTEEDVAIWHTRMILDGLHNKIGEEL